MGSLLPRWRLRVVVSMWGLALLALLLGCTDDPMPVPRWSCPAQWVPHALGGCGPAVILCRPDGGAAQGACDGLDLTHPHPIDNGDGGVGATFYWLSDGGIGGAWPEELPDLTPAAAVGVPAADWAPDAGIPTCPPTWTRLPDGTCEPVFRDNCAPEQEYPDLGTLPTGARVLHVRAGTTVSPADGSESAPYPTVARALGAVVGETWIRIRAGTYQENLAPRGRVHLVGCRQRVTVEGTNSLQPTVYVSQTSTEVELRGISIRGAGIGVGATNGTQVILQDVILIENHSTGVLASGTDTHIMLSDCVVRDTLPRLSDQQQGSGGVAQRGGALVAERTLFQGNREVGTLSLNTSTSGTPSRVALTDCVVRDTLPGRSDQLGGYGVSANLGGVLVANRTLVQANRDVGALSITTSSNGTPSRVELTNCVVRDTAPRQSDQQHGHGVTADSGGVLVAERTLIQGNREAGAFSSATSTSGSPSRVELTDCVVRDTLPQQPDQQRGHGVAAQDGGWLLAERTLIQGNRSNGAWSAAISTSGTPSHVELADCVVRDTLPRLSDLGAGNGVYAQEGGVLIAERTLIQGNRSIGAFSNTTSTSGTPSRVELSDCIVRDTLPRESDQQLGYGVSAQEGGELIAERTMIQGNRSIGAGTFATSTSGIPSRVELSDCIVRDTLPQQSDQHIGYGLIASEGGLLTAFGVLIANSRTTGALNIRGRMLLQDCAIRRTRGSKHDHAQGVAVTAVLGGHIDVRRLIAEQFSEGGVMAGGEGTVVDMADVIIVDSTPERSRGGFGVAMAGGGRAELRRVAVLRTSGAALAAVANTTLLGSPMGSQILLHDGYIRDVAPSAIDYDISNPLRVTGQPRAYGVYVGLSSEMELRRVVMLGGAIGAAAFGGSLDWTDGVASGFTQYFVRGASVMTPALQLQNVMVPGGGAVMVEDDPSVAASFPEPDLRSLPPIGSP